MFGIFVDDDVDRAYLRYRGWPKPRLVHEADVQKNTLQVKVAIESPSPELKPSTAESRDRIIQTIDQIEATRMAFIDTIAPSESRDEVREMYAREEKDWGFVPDYARVFCHRPRVMECWSDLLGEIRRPVDAYRIELATFAAAFELRHSPCSLAHGAKLAEIIGKESLLAIAAGREDEVLEPIDAAIWRYARKIARDASQVTAADIEELRESHGLSDKEIFDIAANAASRCFFTKLLDSLGVDADQGFMDIDPDLRQALTVGRPIADHAPETLARD